MIEGNNVKLIELRTSVGLLSIRDLQFLWNWDFGLSIVLSQDPSWYKYLMVERSEKNPEELPQVHVVGGLLEPEAATVVQVHRELGRKSFAENFHRRRHLLFADLQGKIYVEPQPGVLREPI